MGRFFFLCVFLLISQLFVGQFYQGSNLQFGKNRVQYDEFEWQYYRFEKFETYFYTGGQQIAEYVAKSADEQISEFEKYFDFYVQDKIQFVVYNKHSHFLQSNVGLVDEKSNLGGYNKVIGSKVFLYFNGDHADLERQIREGIARIIIYQSIYGGNWRDAVRNSTTLSLPSWYIDGLVSYKGRGWDLHIENRVKDGIRSGRYKKFTRLEGEEAIIAGHSLWNYVSKTYGEEVIPNIIYLSKLSRNIESGFLFVLGVSVKRLMKEWTVYYEEQYALSDRIAEKSDDDLRIGVRERKNRVYTQLKVDPLGTKYLYAMNHRGKYKVYIYDKNTGKRKKIYKQGYKLDRPVDYEYPLLAWHPSGEILALITEKKGALLLQFYELESKEWTIRPLFKLEKITDFGYANNGRQLIFSGMYEGQSDIYLYNIPGNTQKNLTNDMYDDLDARFIDNDRIVFSSNRSLDSLLFNKGMIDNDSLNKDLFVFDVNEKGNKKLQRVTNTKDKSEREPVKVNESIQYLAESEDVINRFSAEFDSSITGIDTSIHYRYYYNNRLLTDYARNIQEHDANNDAQQRTQIIYEDGRYKMLFGDLDDDAEIILDKGEKQETKSKEKKKDVEEVTVDFRTMNTRPIPDDSLKPEEIDVNNYTFDNKANSNIKIEKKVIRLGEKIKEEKYEQKEFELSQRRNYNLAFSRDESIVQLNNTFLNGVYQPYNGGPFVAPGLGGTILFGISDLFEDHKIYGGIRFSGSNTEYLMGYQNLKRRLDKEYIVSRKKTRTIGATAASDIKTLQGIFSVKWPFTEVTSVRGVLSVRDDRRIPLATDLITLQEQSVDNYWASVKGAYVFDNIIPKVVNINYGLRFKIFAEYYRELNLTESELYVVGADFRHYQKIHREIIWVNRVAGSSSFGPSKLVYYLGGVDDWWGGNKFDFDQPIDDTQGYRFQTIGTNMRGFQQNIRNGNSFAVYNTELRIPVFKYFIRTPIKSQLISNFQVVGFGDVGTAWTGPNPYSEENSFNTDEIENGPINIVLKNTSEPIVAGYGFGLRTMLLGYFIRLDWAWGVQDQVIQDRIFYFSLSLDI